MTNDTRSAHGCQCGWRGLVENKEEEPCPICDGRRLFPVEEARDSGVYPQLYYPKRPFLTKGRCGRCNVELSGRRTAWCSDECYHLWQVETGEPRAVRRALFRRDHGVCIDCKIDVGVLEAPIEMETIEDLLPRLANQVRRLDRDLGEALKIVKVKSVLSLQKIVTMRNEALHQARFPGEFKSSRSRYGGHLQDRWIPTTGWIMHPVASGIRFTKDRTPLQRADEVLEGRITLCWRCARKKQPRRKGNEAA